ncbi:MAG TPA: VWA domain-containing protein [Terriglobia bacterium]|nr:VWA domain-containing protein [Terriglobia bacterium]
MGQASLRVRARGLGRDLLSWVALSVWLLSAGPGATPQNPNPPEVQAHEGQSQVVKPSFQLRVERNLVTVRVVVRDGKDRPVGSLRQEDFRLFDDGKAQDILGFTVETGQPNPAPEAVPSAPAGKTAEVPRAPAKAVAQRFVIVFFDDYHMEAEGIDRTRNAAWRYVTTAVRPQDRVAIFTATGKDQIDFTEDREKLHDALFKLAPRPHPPMGCPQIEEYQAYLIDRRRDTEAFDIAFSEAYHCDCEVLDNKTPSCAREVTDRVQGESAQIWSVADAQSQNALQGIEIAVRRLAAMPGQRSVVLVSPGFLTETQADKIDAITNRALQQEVVISAIDATGLAARSPHIFYNMARADLDSAKTRMENMGTVASGDVMANLSAGTGGVFFHNSNDFNDGFRQAAAVPEVFYVLTFSPPNIKLDGKFHSLKVTLNRREPLTVQARRGYFASATALAGQASSQDELEKAVFSQEEFHGLPAEVTAQVEKTGDSGSKLTVMIHVDVRQLQFRKEADRSVDKLIFHTTLFDRDGKYVAAKEASLDLHLKDATLEKFVQSGLNAKTSFQVAPGTYRVREVVRDTESSGTSALNCVVEVPGPPSQEGDGKPSPRIE